MSTIKAVADLAGVSVGTVSHVITGSVPVSDPLRNKVLAAIRELDYHPNHVARSLKTNRTRTLGIIVPDLTVSFFPQVIRGAETAARDRGYTLIAVNSDDDGDRQKELLSILRSQRTEGILLAVAAAPAPLAQITRMMQAGIPVVCVDRIPDRLVADSVSVEDTSAAEMAIEHLIDMGYRRIALATGPLALKNERRRLLGYRKALERAGIAFDKHLVWAGTLRPEDVAALCREKLQTTEPDAVFATNAPTGLGVLRAFNQLRLRTPEDLGFVTFDELTVDDLFSPAVTAVVQPAFEIGFRAAEILLERIQHRGEPIEPASVRLPASLKVRETSRLRGARIALLPDVNQLTV
jgi:DNA-binding LacI/PurR family transcriptional regulator